MTELEQEQETSTGLPWPKSWKGAYILVACNFVFWLVLLVLLRTIGQ